MAVALITLTVAAYFFVLQIHPAEAFLSSTACPPILPPPFSCYGGPIVGIIPPWIPLIPNPFECLGPQYIIGPPRPAIVAFIPGISRLYARFALREGANVLGNALPAIPFICGTADIIMKIGTSF